MNPRSYFSTNRQHISRVWLILLAVVPIFTALQGCGAKENKSIPQVVPALTVQTATATTTNWPETLQVSGPIVAWQEAIIGSEIAGQRLVELKVNVGDRVKKGQVLARYNADTLLAEQAELHALWLQADADRLRAVALEGKGALSRQQIDSYINQAAVAKARLDAKNLQVRYATVVAPEDGIISARNATVGAIGTVGGELFKLILNGRLEWRGELSAEQLPQVKAGQTVVLTLPDNTTSQAKVRQLSPSLDTQSRMATAYADIQPGSGAHAGMYVSGTIAMQTQPALIVPAVSVVIRDGRTYVFTVANMTNDNVTSNSATSNNASDTDSVHKNSDSVHKVVQQIVTTNRHRGSDVEISAGLKEGARVVMQGAGFLNDGDTVRIVSESAGESSKQ